MPKLARLTLVFACALAQTLASSLPAAAEGYGCPCTRPKCSDACKPDCDESACCRERTEAVADDCACTRALGECNQTCEAGCDKSCFWEQTAAMVGKAIAAAWCDQASPQQAAAPAAYVIEPPDVLSVSFTAAAADCSAKCDNAGRCPCKEKACSQCPARGDCDATLAAKLDDQHCVVAMDGRINLGRFGSVYVAGLTIDEVRQAVDQQVAEHDQFKNARAQVDVVAMNSKAYFVVVQDRKNGDSVSKFPITGNDTVIDAIAAYGEASPSNDCRMWIARPAPLGVGEEQILPINWTDITSGTSTSTNHQLQSGDRLFIRASHEETPAPPQKLRRIGHRLFAPEAATESVDAKCSDRPMICYDAHIVVDPQNCFAEFNELHKQGGVMVADADAMLATLRILEKNNLVGIVSRPKLIVELGRQGALSMGERAEDNGKDIGHWLDLTLSAERVDEKLAVKLDLMQKHVGQQYRAEVDKMIVEEGQVLIVRTRGIKVNADAPELSPTYLFVTPSIVEPADLEGRTVHTYRAASSEKPRASQ